MNTEKLLDSVQQSLTKTMIQRSLPSGGLPIAYRGLLLSLAEDTILKEEPFKIVNGTTVVGNTIAKYYVAGDRPLAEDLANMSAEPFPLITSHAGTDITMEVAQSLTSFKNKVTGTYTGLRYMLLQLSKLGREYMRYIEHQPKTYSMTNDRKVNINFQSHIPAELFRSTNFRTLGRGANMYPLNPSEIFYTMYQMIDKGYDIPVSELEDFKGFDLGDKLNTIYMKPESLASLFDIGIASFVERVHVDVDISLGKVYFKSFHSRYLGETFVRNVQRAIERNDYSIGNVRFDEKTSPVSSVSENVFLEYSNVRFFSIDREQVIRELENSLYPQLLVQYHHYAHRCETIIEDNIEKDIEITSRSVREVLIDCIKNFKVIKKNQYKSEIDELEEELAENIIREKVTRPYLREKIQSLLLSPNDVRVRELKKFVDEKHAEDPDKYPDISEQEIVEYVWIGTGNNVLANLNTEGHMKYLSLIKSQLHRIDLLKEKMKDENIKEEIKEEYLKLSKLDDFKRKSPVLFVNDSLDIRRRELLVEAKDLVVKSELELPTKIHYYPNVPLSKTIGENLPKDYIPTYTTKARTVVSQYEKMANLNYAVSLPDTMKLAELNTIAFPSHFVCPAGKTGIYITQRGYIGIFDSKKDKFINLVVDDFVKDFIVFDSKKDLGKQVVLLKDRGMMLYSLDRLLKLNEEYGELRYAPNNVFLSIKSAEMIENEDELEEMYVFKYHPRTYVKLKYLKNMKNLGEQYYLDEIVSGYKKAYINGIHMPISVVNHLADVNLKDGEHHIDYEYPENLDRYVIILKDVLEDNDPGDIEQLRQEMFQNIRENEMDDVQHFKLGGFVFIREV